MNFEKNFKKPVEKGSGNKETREENVQRALEIINSGKFWVKGFGRDKGKFYVAEKAHLMDDGRINFEYIGAQKGRAPQQISSDSVSVEDFLRWQNLDEFKTSIRSYIEEIRDLGVKPSLRKSKDIIDDLMKSKRFSQIIGEKLDFKMTEGEEKEFLRKMLDQDKKLEEQIINAVRGVSEKKKIQKKEAISEKKEEKVELGKEKKENGAEWLSENAKEKLTLKFDREKFIQQYEEVSKMMSEGKAVVVKSDKLGGYVSGKIKRLYDNGNVVLEYGSINRCKSVSLSEFYGWQKEKVKEQKALAEKVAAEGVKTEKFRGFDNWDPDRKKMAERVYRMIEEGTEVKIKGFYVDESKEFKGRVTDIDLKDGVVIVSYNRSEKERLIDEQMPDYSFKIGEAAVNRVPVEEFLSWQSKEVGLPLQSEQKNIEKQTDVENIASKAEREIAEFRLREFTYKPEDSRDPHYAELRTAFDKAQGELYYFQTADWKKEDIEDHQEKLMKLIKGRDEAWVKLRSYLPEKRKAFEDDLSNFRTNQAFRKLSPKEQEIELEKFLKAYKVQETQAMYDKEFGWLKVARKEIGGRMEDLRSMTVNPLVELIRDIWSSLTTSEIEKAARIKMNELIQEKKKEGLRGDALVEFMKTQDMILDEKVNKEIRSSMTKSMLKKWSFIVAAFVVFGGGIKISKNDFSGPQKEGVKIETVAKAVREAKPKQEIKDNVPVNKESIKENKEIEKSSFTFTSDRCSDGCTINFERDKKTDSTKFSVKGNVRGFPADILVDDYMGKIIESNKKDNANTRNVALLIDSIQNNARMAGIIHDALKQLNSEGRGDSWEANILKRELLRSRQEARTASGADIYKDFKI